MKLLRGCDPDEMALIENFRPLAPHDSPHFPFLRHAPFRQYYIITRFAYSAGHRSPVVFRNCPPASPLQGYPPAVPSPERQFHPFLKKVIDLFTVFDVVHCGSFEFRPCSSTFLSPYDRLCFYPFIFSAPVRPLPDCFHANLVANSWRAIHFVR